MAALAATPATGLVNLEKELVCFICTEILYQPRTLLDCLHTFCGSCLKEWFTHQNRKAAHSHTPPANPYTCPTCRATVKDVQRNATINTFLEMFLAANPGKDRTADEKAEMAQVYKPGDEILPKVESHRRRERKRREEEVTTAREHRAADDAVADERRREQRLDPASAHRRRHTAEGSRSRERREARDRQRDGTQRQRDPQQISETDAPSRRPEASPSPMDNALSPPPPTSPRHPDAVEARQRGARTVAHQASLISLVSASESGTGTGESLNEAQLMQEILDAGLLDGINVDELTEQEQDELSEIIAQRYRELNAERAQRIGSEDTRSNRVPPRAVEPQILEPEQRPRQSSRASNQDRAPPSPRVSHSIVIGGSEARPPTSFPQSTAERTLSLPQSSAHRRRASNESRRSESSTTRTERDQAPQPAARSVTDLSDRPHSHGNTVERLQQQPHAQRSNTEPRTSPRVSEVWQAAGIRQVSGPTQVDSPGQHSPRIDSPRPVMSSVTSGPVPTSIPTIDSAASAPEATASSTATASTRFEEPSIVCARCSRPNIQYEVYKHCNPCGMDICLRCYRASRGCDHWFGFGDAAIRKFNASRPPGRLSQAVELPHIMVGRQYQRPSVSAAHSRRQNTASDPASRLREGNFCDRCGNFANDYFWTCDICNEGEWGFCNDCVNTNHCCDHPLLPVAHRSLEQSSQTGGGATTQPGNATLSPYSAGRRDASPAQSVASSVTSATGAYSGLRADFIPLVITTNCDICTRAISPEETRYHCPTHPTPSAERPDQKGDYDICSTCYNRAVKAGRVKREDGPDGWRLCPDGHRMTSVVFEGDGERDQKRCTVRDVVGGVKMTDADMATWKTAMGNIHRVDPSMLSGARGEWSWREDDTRRATRAQTAGLPLAGAKFPPDGGSGKVCWARWSYYPPEDDGKGGNELMFPKHADVKEVEEINDEWFHGVYAGDAGLFPAIFVRDRN